VVEGETNVRLVGRVLRAHGVHGGLVVEPLTNQPHRFEVGRVLLLGPERRRVTITAASPYKGRLLVRLAEVGDREAAESLRRQDLCVRPEDVGEPPPGEVWASDLEGLDVVDDSGRLLGTVSAVIDNPAHDLLAVADPEGREFLVPLVEAFVAPLAPGMERVVVHPIPGLLAGDDEGPAASVPSP